MAKIGGIKIRGAYAPTNTILLSFLSSVVDIFGIMSTSQSSGTLRGMNGLDILYESTVGLLEGIPYALENSFRWKCSQILAHKAKKFKCCIRDFPEDLESYSRFDEIHELLSPALGRVQSSALLIRFRDIRVSVMGDNRSPCQVNAGQASAKSSAPMDSYLLSSVFSDVECMLARDCHIFQGELCKWVSRRKNKTADRLSKAAAGAEWKIGILQEFPKFVYYIKSKLTPGTSLCILAKFDGAYTWGTQMAGAGIALWFYPDGQHDERKLFLELAVPIRVQVASWSAETTAAAITYRVLSILVYFYCVPGTRGFAIDQIYCNFISLLIQRSFSFKRISGRVRITLRSDYRNSV